jgi:hypothetical protein
MGEIWRWTHGNIKLQNGNMEKWRHRDMKTSNRKRKMEAKAIFLVTFTHRPNTFRSEGTVIVFGLTNL